ncbi:MAG: 4Fe-4S cluster-binding domain-containing protein [Syntrophales bacterium]|nr:4Fe-4S cluster-binding domain-containing protein [Syntrophales bacterium]
MSPAYTSLRGEGKLKKRADTLAGIMRSCVLCPHRCRVDRTAGEKGFCRLDARPMIDSALAHHGEEPALSGHGGAGTIFFSSCNMRCIYCQNYQISHQQAGETIDLVDLSRIMTDLQDRGCHNIDAVTPTPHLPGLIGALLDASQKGLSIPLVYNCGGYENREIIGLLDGIVDIYLPDFKYGNDRDACEFSGVDDYVLHAASAIREMVRQVGDCLEVENGVAKRGVIVRHLVLPGRVENSLEVLEIIKRDISTSLSLSIMSQYTPVQTVASHPLLGRRVTNEEYETVVNRALDMGFDNIFVQDVSERDLTPDFDRDTPFRWE